MKMIEKPYFVLLDHPNGGIMPLVDKHDNMAMFESETEAMAAAGNSSLGSEFGFEIFELGGGVYHQ